MTPNLNTDLRTQHKDRWLVSLFAPDSVRTALQILALFACEIEAIRARAATLPLRDIRYKWWEMQVAGEEASTPLIQALRNVMVSYALPVASVVDFINAHWQEDEARANAIYYELVAYIHAGGVYTLSELEQTTLLHTGTLAAGLQSPSPNLAILSQSLQTAQQCLPACKYPTRKALLPLVLYEEDLWLLQHPTGIKNRLRRAFGNARGLWKLWSMSEKT